MSDCKCQHPCNPCNNNCPDDGEILQVEILDAEDCNTSCCGKRCNDNCGINIQSTNDCLTVDTSECGVVKLTAECPKPTYVKAGDNVTIKQVTPPSDCYVDGGDCGIKGGWEVSSTDEKVKACSGDSTPGYLNQKLQEGTGIIIDEVGCDGSNSKLRISIDEDILPECPDVPDLIVNNQSSIIQTSQSGTHRHVLTITDKTKPLYDNIVCVGFNDAINSYVQMRDTGVADNPTFIGSGWRYGVGNWQIYTGNGNLATSKGIKIQQQGYYRLFGQLTVQNNSGNTRYINLGRGLLLVDSPQRAWLSQKAFYLSTAKHGSYARHVFPTGGKGITIDADGQFSITRATVTTDGEGGTYEVVFDNGSGQPTGGHDGPWMTFNMDCYVDLWEGDEITLGYRCQTDMEDGKGKWVDYRFVGVGDPTTEYHSLFGGTCLGVQMISPTLFQKDASSGTEVWEWIGH